MGFGLQTPTIKYYNKVWTLHATSIQGYHFFNVVHLFIKIIGFIALLIQVFDISKS